MDIKELKKKDLQEIAKRANTTLEYLLQIKYGRRRPSPELAFEIEKATDGKIKKETLIWPKNEMPS